MVWLGLVVALVAAASACTPPRLYGWGANANGQVGDGTTITPRVSPTPVSSWPGWHDWRVVVAGDGHSAAIDSDGSLWMWGSDSYGQLGDGTPGVGSTSPVRIGTDTNWATLSLGTYHTLATRTDGSLWAWGRNEYGQLGTTTSGDRYTPTQIGTGTTWRMAAAGQFHSAAIDTDGKLWTWGISPEGQLGHNSPTPSRCPSRSVRPATGRV